MELGTGSGVCFVRARADDVWGGVWVSFVLVFEKTVCRSFDNFEQLYIKKELVI